MKVVLFCGGLGTRLRDYSEKVPKPMVNIGYRPILWHLMKYYAHYGHKDFILCLGYKADYIKEYFLNYNECLSNDFVLSAGGKQVQMIGSDIHDWRITFVDTGLSSNIGQRLKAVEKYLEGEEMFLANYSDGLSNLPLDDFIDHFMRHDKVASFLSVKPTQTFHVVSTQEDGLVKSIEHVNNADLRINGGFFALKTEIFKYMQPGEELVIEPFQRLIEKEQLVAYNYDGFWTCMDTFRDKQNLDDMYSQGNPPWEVWKTRKTL
ncbi:MULTISPECIES: glucose-1-phosphate cytidylyltransferase [Leptolyngbya]|jgi:glucose-1-phosphate cytidylyltransferase|uniref:Glucose-1-phosphate cytidylyltransferase n=2 Tax=Leptolyngbya boryana TaxID=1184 RepID=A0A1Z4JE89_LEPBY|nr:MULTISPECIES: glucose-1-phosphate cytidylyltransferase [Leptolyngbya]BAY55056.1 glucose-1-phosphate cytidylyltransferase [Leptolyngbya boryana NIES-2135]MBD1859577.1 glucose-1-phosphate cytidylyltransferase [Leptolyngbya sp. FACHB-1624]MBD2366036.1 glucose-1-phosphate cytidylyltransferase [Leptolyngbya sp. FACHB-161]MBD2372216.1 glucose-1-phosphate cytidylyltransferase [Leptolyngbya sp. FACHB-238]MBD2396639.1 glucose-1-phosphate cytidylyltransferase [Leptolyngbya sp. FACHB-239]